MGLLFISRFFANTAKQEQSVMNGTDLALTYHEDK